MLSSAWATVNSLYKGAIRDVEMGFISGVKSLGCYNNNYRLDSLTHRQRERICGLQNASSAMYSRYQGISWCKCRNKLLNESFNMCQLFLPASLIIGTNIIVILCGLSREIKYVF